MMELMAIPVETVMRDLLPDLKCTKGVPRLMARLVQSEALGIANQHGFYRYSPARARCCKRLFLKLSYEVRAQLRNTRGMSETYQSGGDPSGN